MVEKVVENRASDFFKYLAGRVCMIPFGAEDKNTCFSTFSDLVINPDVTFTKLSLLNQALSGEVSFDEYNAYCSSHKLNHFQFLASDIFRALFLSLVYSQKQVDMRVLYRPERFVFDYLFGHNILHRSDETDKFELDYENFILFLTTLLKLKLFDVYEFLYPFDRYFLSLDTIHANYADFYQKHPSVTCHPMVYDLIVGFQNRPPVELKSAIDVLFDALYRLVDLSDKDTEAVDIPLLYDPYFFALYPGMHNSFKDYEADMVDFLVRNASKFPVHGKVLTFYLPEGYQFALGHDVPFFHRLLNHFINNVFFRKTYWLDLEQHKLFVNIDADNLLLLRGTYFTGLIFIVNYLVEKFRFAFDSIVLTIILNPDVSNLENIDKVIHFWENLLRDMKVVSSFAVVRETSDEYICGTIARFDLTKPLEHTVAIYPINNKYLARVDKNNPPETITAYKIIPPDGYHPDKRFGLEPFLLGLNSISQSKPVSTPVLDYDDWFIESAEALLSSPQFSQSYTSLLEIAMRRLQASLSLVNYQGKLLADYMTGATFAVDDTLSLAGVNLLGNFVIPKRTVQTIDGKLHHILFFANVNKLPQFVAPMLLAWAYHVLNGVGLPSVVDFYFNVDDVKEAKFRMAPWLTNLFRIADITEVNIYAGDDLVAVATQDDIMSVSVKQWMNSK